LIEDAYRLGEAMGLSVWCTDQAGPFQTIPQPGTSWQPEGHPARQPHESFRNGTAKVMTLFHPADGEVRVKGVTACPNAVLHGWLKEELAAVLAGLPAPPILPDAEVSMRSIRERWQADLTIKATLSAGLPPLRMLLVLDNLAGHKTPEFVLWLFSMGIMPRYTPLGGSWLNLVESLQRILKRRALDGQHPGTPQEIMGWFEAVAGHWNRSPTPFEWGGKRASRRERQRERRRLGGSGACISDPLNRPPPIYGDQQTK
jgi:hypothetical protein